MKDKVLTIVQSALVGAEDNLHRANMQFGKMGEKEMKQEYGNSGRTRSSILSGYQTARDELKRCVAWVNSAT